MLATETPPDPSSSTSKIFPLKADERAPAELPLQEADPPVFEETATPSFCIRDFVFASRNNGIPTNWPFTKESLHLCLKHGIKDPLPPFEAPASVRVRCLGKIAGTDHLVTQSTGEEIVAHSDLLKTRNIGLSKGHPSSIRDVSFLSSEGLALDCAGQDNNSPFDEGKSTVHPRTRFGGNLEPVDMAEKSCRRLENNCRLPVKFGVTSGINLVEEIASHSRTESNSMASKVCPVCKTFSSTSNTTLNAHIDQCLSTESNTNEVLREFPKSNVKPRKKRLMVDIYTTAAHYTLEDLDRKNGTNWAMEVALLARPATDVAPVTSTDTKTSIDSRDDKREGTVFVDSKGIKVRTLSNFNNIPLTSKDFELQGHKNWKSRENFLIEKGKNFPLKHSTNMKLKGQKRKSSSLNLQVKLIPAIPRGSVKINSRKSDTYQSELWKDQSQVRCNKSPFFCQSTSTDNPDSPPKPDNNFVERLRPRWDSDLTQNTRTKRATLLCSTAQSVVHGKQKTTELPVSHSRSSANDLVMTLSGNHTSCTRSKEDNATSVSNDVCGMTGTPSENFHSLMNSQNNLTMKNNESTRSPSFCSETNEADVSEDLFLYNKFRKLKSNKRTARRRREFRPPYNVVISAVSKDHGFDLRDKAKPLGSCQSAFSKYVKMSDAGEIMNQLSPSQVGVQESDGRKYSNTMEQEQNSSKRHPIRYECQMQDEISESRVDNIAEDVDLNTTACGMQLKPSSFMEDHHYTLSRNKTTVQFNQEFNIQYISHDDIAANEIVNQDTESGDETLVREVNDSWSQLLNKCHGDAVAVQCCDSSLTSQGDLGLEMHSKNSLTASVCQTIIPDKSASSEHEQSSSHVSTASTVYLPSPDNPKFHEPEVKVLKNSVILYSKLCTEGPFTQKSQGTQGKDIGGRIIGAKETIQGDEPDYIFSNKPFCCSCKESLSIKSQLTLNDTTRKAEAQQVSNLVAGPRTYSSFTPYQNKTTTVASTALQSHKCGTLPKSLIDLAATNPVLMDTGFPTPSHSQSRPPCNPVLRLMGKNLTVVNNEEFVQPQTTTSDYPPTVNYSPAFASTNNFLDQESFPYHHQPTLIGSSASSSRAIPIADGLMHQHYLMASSGDFVSSPYSKNWVRIQGQQSEQMKLYENLIPVQLLM